MVTTTALVWLVVCAVLALAWVRRPSREAESRTARARVGAVDPLEVMLLLDQIEHEQRLTQARTREPVPHPVTQEARATIGKALMLNEPTWRWHPVTRTRLSAAYGPGPVLLFLLRFRDTNLLAECLNTDATEDQLVAWADNDTVTAEQIRLLLALTR